MITLCSVLATYVMHRQVTKPEKEVVGRLNQLLKDLKILLMLMNALISLTVFQ